MARSNSNPKRRAPIVPEIPGYYSAVRAAQETDGMHTRWAGVRHYTRGEGIALMPQTGPVGTAAKIVNLCAPTGMMAFEWVATRINAIPLCPTKTPPSPANEILSGISIGLPNTSLMPDGQTRVITVTGCYYYLLLVPPDENYSVPVPAYDGHAAIPLTAKHFLYNPDRRQPIPAVQNSTLPIFR